MTQDLWYPLYSGKKLVKLSLTDEMIGHKATLLGA
jgi:ribosomal protein S19